MRAFAAVNRYAAALAAAERPGVAPLTLPDLTGRGVLAEHEGKAILKDLGIAVPAGALVTNADEATTIAGRIGYPVVIKVQASAIAHKSDIGGVIVGLADEATLRAGWDQLMANVSAAHPGVALDGVLVEAMAPRGLEMVVGARAHPEWGATVPRRAGRCLDRGITGGRTAPGRHRPGRSDRAHPQDEGRKAARPIPRTARSRCRGTRRRGRQGWRCDALRRRGSRKSTSIRWSSTVPAKA